MSSSPLVTIIFIANILISTAAIAEKSYKCGNTYSQTACADGIVINTADPRTSAQKNQTDLAISRDIQTADAMEKARLLQEKTTVSANKIPAQVAVKAEKPTPHTSSKAKKKKKTESAYFTAQTPTEKKVKKAPKKKVANKA